MQECTHSPNNMSLSEVCQIMVDKGSINLSRGQKKRLAITRAITGGSIILLLNERSSALDGVNERLSQERQVAAD
jgi:ABC-type multidrug transport system fused ATPase/permease subunit